MEREKRGREEEMKRGREEERKRGERERGDLHAFDHQICVGTSCRIPLVVMVLMNS